VCVVQMQLYYFIVLFMQAVKYSRDYKRKYDFFRSKLRKPVCISVAALIACSYQLLIFAVFSFLPLDTMLAWYMLSLFVCVYVLSICHMPSQAVTYTG